MRLYLAYGLLPIYEEFSAVYDYTPHVGSDGFRILTPAVLGTGRICLEEARVEDLDDRLDWRSGRRDHTQEL